MWRNCYILVKQTITATSSNHAKILAIHEASREYFYPLILSQFDAYAWFEEAEHVMFLKLEFWKKACIFKGAIFEGG
ncbi:copia-like polyprotein [Cucumis melo var. makuwa]|uniref:Copia-like polyprotein n=1 Tax=Cucumis melo var. makuwa TaxID=1194695 RepID=A0A5D3CVC4_CUCMM|nr:copia-like polyprotein [Cucumis melo var. makuwa]